jgi:hypothetical protein
MGPRHIKSIARRGVLSALAAAPAGDRRQARRYHWLSEGLQSFVDEPHAAIDGIEQGVIVNLTDRQAAASRQGQLDILCRLGPDGIERQLADLEERVTESRPPQAQPLLPYLVMPEHHDVRAENIVTRRLHGNLAAAAEPGPADFSELLLVPGVGAYTIRALAMVAEVVHGAPYRFSDPARFPLAHGGKDRHPYPVSPKVYDRTIGVLKTAVQKAKLGQSEELAAIKRLDEQAGRLERNASGPSVEALVTEDRARSHQYGGRRSRWTMLMPPGGDETGRLSLARAGRHERSCSGHESRPGPPAAPSSAVAGGPRVRIHLPPPKSHANPIIAKDLDGRGSLSEPS